MSANFVTKGCDYTSFSHGIGKVVFLKYSDFISAGTDYPSVMSTMSV